MARAYRRYKERVKRIRRINILSDAHYWRYRYEFYDGKSMRLWRGYHKLCMNTPNWWNHQYSIEPSRSKQNHQLKKVVLGYDSEGMVWPNYRKPHIYYW